MHGHFSEQNHNFERFGTRDWKAAYFYLWTESMGAAFASTDRALRQHERSMDKIKAHIDTIRTAKVHRHFLLTEWYFHNALVSARFEREVDALFSFRQAYNLLEEGQSLYPDFKYFKKTSGLVKILLGSVPENFQWVLQILGWSGDVKEGMEDLSTLNDDTDFGIEVRAYQALTKAYVLEDFAKAEKEMAALYEQYSEWLLAYLYMAILSKNSNAQKIIDLSHTQAMGFHKSHYLVGEAYLQRADYDSALYHYSFFQEYYPDEGELLKDTYYKMYLCYYLMEDFEKADSLKTIAAQRGNSRLETDRYASQLIDREVDILLMKSRLASDGGFYVLAQGFLNQFKKENSNVRGSKLVEMHYRQARISHKLGNFEVAKSSYQLTIDNYVPNSQYYAPNSALQLGKIAMNEGDLESAEKWLKKCLDYKGHEYKRSIERKARALLNTLESTQR